MEIENTLLGDVAVFRPKGSIDAITAPVLAGHIQDLVGQTHVRLVADLTDVDYTSSAGLRVLLGAVKDTRGQGGDIRLAGVRPDVLKVLTLSGFTSILKLFDDVGAAAESFA